MYTFSSVALPNLSHIMVSRANNSFHSTLGKDTTLVVTQLYPVYPPPEALRTQAFGTCLVHCAAQTSPPLQTTLKFCYHFCLIKNDLTTK